jgi:hypothetical protein
MSESVELDGNLVTVQLTGTLTQGALSRVQREVGGIIRTHGRIRILVLAQQFDGWEKRANWDDFSFQEEYDLKVERMAIVGDRRWEDLVLMFAGKGLRALPIEYFGSDEVEKARSWLAASPPNSADFRPTPHGDANT